MNQKIALIKRETSGYYKSSFLSKEIEILGISFMY